MARKRKLVSSSSNEPAKKQQQQQQKVVEEVVEEQVEHKEVEEEEERKEVKEAEEHKEVQEEEEEYEEVEEEEEDEEEEEEEDDDDEEKGDEEGTGEEAKTANDLNQTADDDEEPIEKLLEPFGKEQLAYILREAAEKHRDVAHRIKEIAEEDPAHRKIFVYGLGWDTTAETLTSVFKEYGDIEDCKAVCDKVSGKSKGYGFILFKTRSGARKALKEPQKKIGNRMTSSQLASVGVVPAAASVQPQGPSSEYTLRKIYVSNVGAELDPQKLTVFFAKYGEIEEGPLGLDKVTGKPKGFCLFVYKTVDGARKALAEPHKNFEGNILHCQKAIDGPKPGKSHHNQHHHHNQRNKNPGFGGAQPGPAVPGHLMAPAGPGGFTQGAAAAQALNPALGQAITALLASQGSGMGLTNLLGTLGSAAGVAAPGVAGPGQVIQPAYGNQASMYGNQGGMQGGYPNQQMGQGGTGRGQGGVGQYGGAPAYMGH